eukprot:2166957-Alexandrium_andersonii.AAC.1
MAKVAKVAPPGIVDESGEGRPPHEARLPTPGGRANSLGTYLPGSLVIIDGAPVPCLGPGEEVAGMEPPSVEFPLVPAEGQEEPLIQLAMVVGGQ